MKFKKLALDQKGSHLVVVALAIVVIGAAGFTGYKVYQNRNSNSKTPTTASTQSTTSASTSTAPATIQTKAQLSQASASLSAMDSQLNSGLDTSSLNTYISGTL